MSVEAVELDTPPSASATPTSRARARKALRVATRVALAALFVALALGGAAVAVTLFGTQTYHWRAFDIEAGIEPALHGETRLIFAPLGEVRARTHRTPIALCVSLRGISFDAMKQLIVSPPPRKALEADFQRTARIDLADMARRQIALGAVGALCAPLLLRTRRLRWWLLSPLIGGGFVALVFLTAIRTFDPHAFENPTYTGSLRQADWIIALVKDGFNRAEALSDKLERVADNLDTLYGRINAIPGVAADKDTVRVLHISDIHNNPAAVRFVRELASRMKVDAVIDTGDLTDFGTPLETHLSRITDALDVPYLFVAGNHDSQATVAAVRKGRTAYVLNDVPVEVAGLTVLGAPDPSSARPGPGNVNTSPQALADAGRKLLAAYNAARDKPDVVCVHDPLEAAPLLGVAPLVLCGHEHRAYVERTKGTVVCNAGTTGAAGARYFDHKQGVPFSAAILTFRRGPRPRLLFIDQVVLDGALNQYSITRRTMDAANASEPPVPPDPAKPGAAAKPAIRATTRTAR